MDKVFLFSSFFPLFSFTLAVSQKALPPFNSIPSKEKKKWKLGYKKLLKWNTLTNATIKHIKNIYCQVTNTTINHQSLGASTKIVASSVKQTNTNRNIWNTESSASTLQQGHKLPNQHENGVATSVPIRSLFVFLFNFYQFLLVTYNLFTGLLAYSLRYL